MLPSAPTCCGGLYTTPPPEFVTARTALVKELRAAGERPSATAVAALRKPSTVDWALNVVASEHPDVVAAYLDAAAQVRDAQVAAAEGRAPSTDGRAALTALRAAVGKVVERAEEVASNHGGGRGALVAPATARLSALVADVDASEQLRHGHLGSSPAEAVDPFAGLSPFDTPTPAADRPTRRPRSTGRRGAPTTASTDEREAKARRPLADALAAAERDRDAARRAGRPRRSPRGCARCRQRGSGGAAPARGRAGRNGRGARRRGRQARAPGRRRPGGPSGARQRLTAREVHTMARALGIE